VARVHGRNGQMYVGIATSAAAASPLPFIVEWTADFKTGPIDVTAFGDGNHVYVTGLPDGAGQFSGFYDSATAQTFTAAQDGNARNFYFYPTTPSTAGPYWYGTAFFDFAIKVNVGAANTISGNWVPASTLTKVG
jgi:hypothetical protein